MAKQHEPQCFVCLRPAVGNMNFCTACKRSYDRHVAHDDGTVFSVLEWAATRARRFALEKPPTPAKKPTPRTVACVACGRVILASPNGCPRKHSPWTRERGKGHPQTRGTCDGTFLQGDVP